MTKIKTDRRSQLRAAYLYVVDEWAPEASEIARYLLREGYLPSGEKGLTDTKKPTRSLLNTLRRNNLVVDHVVNGEGPAVWQSYYSIQDGDDRSKAEADFDKAFPEGTVKESTKTGTGAYGARYTEEQLNEAAKLRGHGKTWKEIGAALGIKATAHLAKTMRIRDAKITNEVAQDLGKAAKKAKR